MSKVLILIALSLFLSGCAVCLLGAGAAGGYALSKDYIQGEYDKNFESVYGASLKISEMMGVVESKFSNPSLAIIKARVDNAKVMIYIERLTQNTLRLKVKSRKNLMPDTELAQRVYNKIICLAR